MSCKAFFRRNALSNKVRCIPAVHSFIPLICRFLNLQELTCPFNDNCSIDIITRRFCTKCRLRRCFAVGMRKEWILSEEEREKIREKIRLNKIKRQEDLEKQLKGQQWAAAMGMNAQPNNSFEPSSSSSLPPDSTTPECTTSFPINAATSSPADMDILASIVPSIFTPTPANSSFQEAHLQPPSNSNNNNGDQRIEQSITSSDELLFDNLITEEILMQESDSNNNNNNNNNNNTDPDHFEHLDYLDLDSLNSPSTANSHSQLSLFQASKYESILEFRPTFSGQLVSSEQQFPPACFFFRLHPDINAFPYQELILPESCLLQELSSACSVLQNPYKRIQYLESFNVEDASRITQFMFHRLISASKGLSAFNGLSREDQGLMMKLSLLKMLSIRTVIMYNASRECWGFINVRFFSSKNLK